MHILTVTLTSGASHQKLEHCQSHIWNRIQAPLDYATIEVGGKVGEGLVDVGSEGCHRQTGLRTRID